MKRKIKALIAIAKGICQAQRKTVNSLSTAYPANAKKALREGAEEGEALARKTLTFHD